MFNTKKLTKLKPDGYIHIDTEYGIDEHDTVQCVHCGCHFIIIPNSDRIRGFCLNCKGMTCGSKQCDVCIPYKKLIESISLPTI